MKEEVEVVATDRAAMCGTPTPAPMVPFCLLATTALVVTAEVASEGISLALAALALASAATFFSASSSARNFSLFWLYIIFLVVRSPWAAPPSRAVELPSMIVNGNGMGWDGESPKVWFV